MDIYVQVALFGMLARMVDIPLGILKLAALNKGDTTKGPIFAGLETGVYTLAASPVFANIKNPIVFVCFVLGVMIGTRLGQELEKRTRTGNDFYFIITDKAEWSFPDYIREKGYMATTIKGTGGDESTKAITISIIPHREQNAMREIIEEHHLGASVFILAVADLFKTAAVSK